MVELGCQDTDWVDENDKEVLDAILFQDRTINTVFFGFVFFCFDHKWAKSSGNSSNRPTMSRYR